MLTRRSKCESRRAWFKMTEFCGGIGWQSLLCNSRRQTETLNKERSAKYREMIVVYIQRLRASENSAFRFAHFIRYRDVGYARIGGGNPL